MKSIWQRVAPLVRDQKLLGILLEVSYDNSRPDNLLFGHLTPKYMVQEMTVLANEVANLTGGSVNTALAGLNVIVSHIKPALKVNIDIKGLVKTQLDAANTLGINYYLPGQGKIFTLGWGTLTEDVPSGTTGSSSSSSTSSTTSSTASSTTSSTTSTTQGTTTTCPVCPTVTSTSSGSSLFFMFICLMCLINL